MDPDIAKIRLMCKWIRRAMESGEFNLQFMLRYKLAMFNPKNIKSEKLT